MPKISELDDKLTVTAGFEGHLTRASALRHHSLALAERDAEAPQANVSCVAPLRTLDSCDDERSVIDALSTGVPHFLLTSYRILEAALDPLLDARLIGTLQAAVAALSSEHTIIGTSAAAPDVSHPLTAALHAAADVGRRPALLGLDEILWPPVDRVHVPARLVRRQRPTVGSRAHFRKGSRLTTKDLSGRHT